MFSAPRRKRLASFLLLAPTFVGMLLLISNRQVSAANPTTMNFQGKVVNTDGTNVTNGTYSFVFRIYNTVSPTTATSCTSTATCLWEETQASVTVTNGVFQVELGAACALTSSSCNNSAGGPINWSTTSSLYLTMNFNGDSAGFMSPTIHVTSVPFAFNADQLGGISAGGFIQNTTSPQSSANFNIDGSGVVGVSLQTPLISSGAGDLALQPASGIVALNKISTDNEIKIYENGASPTHYISIKYGDISTDSGDLTVAAAGTTKIGNGTGDITLNAGSGSAVNITAHASSLWQADSGSISIQGAGGLNLLASGSSNIVIGTSDTTGTLLVLDTKTDSGDPSGVNGGLYYNSNASRFRCYEGGVWKNCIGSESIHLAKTGSASQDIGGANGTIQYISWDNELNKDSLFSHDNATNNTRITVNQDGIYEIKAAVGAKTTGSARSTIQVYFRINGSTDVYLGSGRNYSRGSVYGGISMQLNTEYSLSAGDYIEIATVVDDTDATYTINTNTNECDVILRRVE